MPDSQNVPDSVRSAIALFDAMPSLPAILKLLRDQTGMGFVGIARVTPERWVTCAVLDDAGLGLKVGDELDVNTTLCRAQLEGPHTIAFDDARGHPVYGRHPAPLLYGFRSHISAPICLADGSYFGSLCGLDPEPRSIADTRGAVMVENMAALIGRLLDEALAHAATAQALRAEREVGDSREQFIAVVAHDLRAPLGTMRTAVEILLRADDARGRKMGERLRLSADRMTGLLDDLVDFSRGRAGRAMPVELVRHSGLGAALQDVVDEARLAHPGRDLHACFRFDGPVLCDPARLQQLLSNLLVNALAYGAADAPVRVEASDAGGVATLVVENRGPRIPPERLERMFDAYWSADANRTTPNMGLGLHICQLIARAHQGTLRVASSEEHGTRFTLEWPGGAEPGRTADRAGSPLPLAS
ncbi:MAG: HAMP domain-containing sensor histidine kinase [Xylophilus ampelinus]